MTKHDVTIIVNSQGYAYAKCSCGIKTTKNLTFDSARFVMSKHLERMVAK